MAVLLLDRKSLTSFFHHSFVADNNHNNYDGQPSVEVIFDVYHMVCAERGRAKSCDMMCVRSHCVIIYTQF